MLVYTNTLLGQCKEPKTNNIPVSENTSNIQTWFSNIISNNTKASLTFRNYKMLKRHQKQTIKSIMTWVCQKHKRCE